MRAVRNKATPVWHVPLVPMMRVEKRTKPTPLDTACASSVQVPFLLLSLCGCYTLMFACVDPSEKTCYGENKKRKPGSVMKNPKPVLTSKKRGQR